GGRSWRYACRDRRSALGVGGPRSAALPAGRKLRFEPFAAVAAKPVRARAPGVVDLAFDDAQGGGLVAFAFEPQVGAALVHGDFPRSEERRVGREGRSR